MFYPYEGYRSVTPLDAARVNIKNYVYHTPGEAPVAARPLRILITSYIKTTLPGWYVLQSAVVW